MAQARGACRREQGDEPETNGRANFERVREIAALTAPQKNFGLPCSSVIVRSEATKQSIHPLCRVMDCFASLAMTAAYGSTDAGGEDTGYFAHWKKRVRIPPLTHALWRCPGKGCHAPQRRRSARSTCVAVTDADIACSPACPLPMRKHRHGGGEDACYFGQSAGPLRRRGGRGFKLRRLKCRSSVRSQSSNSIDRSPPTSYTFRGEDCCYFVCNTRGRGFESRPASYAPVAQRLERYLARFRRAGVSAIARSRTVYPTVICVADHAFRRW